MTDDHDVFLGLIPCPHCGHGSSVASHRVANGGEMLLCWHDKCVYHTYYNPELQSPYDIIHQEKLHLEASKTRSVPRSNTKRTRTVDDDEMMS